MIDPRDKPLSRQGGLYAALWRLHFFAGLIVAPVLLLMAATGGLYLFKAEIDLPTGAPIGVYSADIFLFQDGQPVSSRTRGLTVEKAGIERALYLFAHQRPWSYGLASVAIALAAGWAASVAFRRN